MLDWIRLLLVKVDIGTNIILGMDLNDGLGIPQNKQDHSEHIGTCNPAEEHEAAKGLRNICQEYGLVVVNTKYCTDPTFYSAHRRSASGTTARRSGHGTPQNCVMDSSSPLTARYCLTTWRRK